MNIFRLAFELFALYLLYKLIFDFIIPVAKSAKQVKKQFNQMNAQMQDQMKRQETEGQQASASSNSNPSFSKPPKDDYIDFEEVK